ncbi:DUF4870 family protein [Chitinimonas sp. BJB300]|uniref:DUF4870 family protein n=1 Tax=Chitinimonas sp. BJB300 TaxID=1559339 RepID=UPI000C0C6EF0|nr:hypothetical protein [Chitinimonas sp. BJB300]PHV10955.1 hypothetical protein CSQ89_13410 [Chitinimonas sp. BJB300]TSJ89890.1 hypothetical protein FG002_006710 [Chitinimonas sp. BJB300]
MTEQTLLPEQTERTLNHLALAVYILIGISLFTALATGIVGVLIAHLKRDEARGTWLESHFTWLIQTFWYSIAGYALSALLFLTIIGIPLAALLCAATWIWSVYRLVVGYVSLNQARALVL